MNIYLSTIGCRLNEAELETWSRQFAAAGHGLVSSPQQAQILIMNSCAVTAEAARKSRQFINRLHRQNPNAKLVVTGCYAELEPAKVAALTGVDMVVCNRDKDKLVDMVVHELDLHAMPQLATQPESSHVYHSARTRAFVKVQDGCRNRCTFCIVTIARGAERSRRIDDVVEEINLLHDLGYQEAVLTGVHLGGYGDDIGADLYSLVDAILRNTNIPRLRLSSLEPWDLPDRFFDLWANPRLMPHLHLPLQSGCDSTLQRMARRCDTSSYADLIASAGAAIPDLSITTDLIVGFPGETGAEWAATIAYVRQMDFAHMHIFTYSARQGTTAARLRGRVQNNVKRARSRQLHEIAAGMKAAHLSRFVGTSRRVLWEGQGTALDDGALKWSGYTDNYLRVETVTQPEVDLGNLITSEILASISGDPPDHLLATPNGPRGGTVTTMPHSKPAQRPLFNQSSPTSLHM